MIFLVYIWCLDCVCENEACGYVTRKGAAPVQVLRSPSPSRSRSKAPWWTFYPSAVYLRCPVAENSRFLFSFFFRPGCPLQPCRSVGAGDPREPCASKLPRSDPHSALAKSPPAERPSGPAAPGSVFGPFFHPSKNRSIWRFRRVDWHSAGSVTLFAMRAEEPIQGILRLVST